MASRPVWGSGARDRPVVVEAYRGYGRPGAAFVCGRVFRQPVLGIRSRRGSFFRDVLELLRHFFRWGLSGRRVRVRLGDDEARVETRSGGWFAARVAPRRFDGEGPWQEADVQLEGTDVHARGGVYAPPEDPGVVVVSDIDDTVMDTGVGKKTRMLWNLFFTDADARTAFPGVPTFYQALHRGASTTERNPMLYVSRAPWSIRPVIEQFFQERGIPEGPIVFLRDWGLSLQHPLPKKSEDHKRELIETMLDIYSEQEFVLIGDSGQHDPEVYADIAEAWPGRVRAIYIRDVTGTDRRARAIAALSRRVEDAGGRMVLAAGVETMARDAAERGLISKKDLGGIEE